MSGSKFENETEKKVREILYRFVYDNSFPLPTLELHKQMAEKKTEDLMLRIRPYLKVQRKLIGDAL